MADPQAQILVVDDNEHNRDMLARRLQRQGYRVTLAEHGRQVLEQGDVEEALNAAAQIGDDKLQAGSGRIRPETFTHGTSAQRAAWFKRGIGSGRLADCNTFDARVL